MTEAEWLTCTDPNLMLEFLRGKVSDRKLRLFKTACCRRIWPLLTDDRSRGAIEAAEAFADGQIPTESFHLASQTGRAAFYVLNETLKQVGTTPSLQARLFAANAACGATCESYPKHHLDACSYAILTSEAIGNAVGHSSDYNSRFSAKKAAELKGHIAILRDVVGNPFRPVTIDPTCLAWNDATVPKIAAAIYADRSFGDLPILADALEDAGCSDATILEHLRSGGAHCRGCFVLDAILGKS